MEGGRDLTLRDEYFAGGASKRRFAQEEKVPLHF